jgi:hypothetical protein
MMKTKLPFILIVFLLIASANAFSRLNYQKYFPANPHLAQALLKMKPARVLKRH